VQYFLSLLLVFLSVRFVEPQLAVDLEKEKADLLVLHKADREAHFKTDVDLLQASSPDEFISVSDGKIYRTTKADERKRFTDYFKDAKYQEWDDVEAPVVRIAKDASMAWMITRVRVIRTQKDATGVERERKFIYAGIMTYEKRAGKWIRVANVSTFER
jgi:hypothetical protein